jgi:hypothetical protein
MREDELKAAEQLRDEIRREKLRTYDYLKYLMDMPAGALVTVGHRRGLPQAMFDTMLNSQKRLKKLESEFLKKFPD